MDFSVLAIKHGDLMRSSASFRLGGGMIFIVFGSIFFSGFLYATVISKLLLPSEYAIISAIQNDRYYCFLVPLTLPILLVTVYFHWVSMKLFKHA